MFGWLKSIFSNEPEQERIVPPPLPSKVKKAEKLVSKKVAKKASLKKEVTKKEAPKKEASKETTTKPKSSNKKKETVVENIVESNPIDIENNPTEKPAPKKRTSRLKKV